MKYCQECGRMLRDTDESCPHCGTYQDILSAGYFTDAFTASGVNTDSFEPENKAYYDSSFEAGGASASGAFDAAGASASGGSTYVNYDYASPAGASYAGAASGGDYAAPTGAVADGGEPIRKYKFLPITLLTIVTFGIYGLYKNYKWTKDVNRLCKGVGKDSMNYILVVLLSVVTFGIYGYYWFYQQTERLKETGYRNGIVVEDSGVQNLLLLILTGGIGALAVWYILYDNTNRLSMVYNGEGTREQANLKTSHKGAIIATVIITIAAYVMAFIVAVLAAFFSVTGDTAKTDEWNWEEDLPSENGEIPFDIEDEFDIDDPTYSFNTEDYISQGKSADLGDYSISIDKALNVYDFAGNRSLAVTFTWTNDSDEEASALWVFLIEARQNGELLDVTWPKEGDKDVSMDEYIENIEPGESQTFQVMFQVKNESDPVNIRVIDSFGESDKMAEHIFTIS